MRGKLHAFEMKGLSTSQNKTIEGLVDLERTSSFFLVIYYRVATDVSYIRLLYRTKSTNQVFIIKISHMLIEKKL